MIIIFSKICAVAFSLLMKKLSEWVKSLSHVRLFATSWTVACQTCHSMGFSRQEYWSGLPCPPPADLPDPGIEPVSLMFPALTGGFFTTSTTYNSFSFAVLCLVTQSCLTLCDPMNCSLPDSSVHGILQARILEWVAMPSSSRSSQPRDQTQISHIADGFFTI